MGSNFTITVANFTSSRKLPQTEICRNAEFNKTVVVDINIYLLQITCIVVL
jgi:hypothetical protein